MVILFVTEKQKILCQMSFHTHFKMGKDTQGNKPLINYSTIQRGTKLKLPRPAKNLISSFPINFINTRVGEKRGHITRKGAFHFLLDLK